MGMMSDAIQDGIHHERIRKNGSPINDSPIFGEDHGFRGISCIDDVVKIFRRNLLDFLKSKSSITKRSTVMSLSEF